MAIKNTNQEGLTNLIIILAVAIIIAGAGYLFFTKKPPVTAPPLNEGATQLISDQSRTDLNVIKSIKSAQQEIFDSNGKPGKKESVIKIEVSSNREFPVRNELAVLSIGAQEFLLSGYADNGSTHTLIFTLTSGEFNSTSTGEPVSVYYGRGGQGQSRRWDFGKLDKSILKTQPTKN